MNIKEKIEKLSVLMSEIDNDIINYQNTEALKYLRLFTDDVEEIEGMSYYVDASPSYNKVENQVKLHIAAPSYISGYGENVICLFKYNHQTFELSYLKTSNEIEFNYHDDVEKKQKHNKIHLNKLKLQQIIVNKLLNDKTILQKVHDVYLNEKDVESVQQKKEMAAHFLRLMSNNNFKHERMKDEVFEKGGIELNFGISLTAFNGERRYINKMKFMKNPSGTYTVELLDSDGRKVSSSKRASYNNIDMYVDRMVREKISEERH